MLCRYTRDASCRSCVGRIRERLTMHIIIIIITIRIIIIGNSRMKRARTSPAPGPLNGGRSEDSDDAVPIVLYRVPGYLARRFQQICAAIITESLAADGLTQLQLGVISCVDD